MDEHPNAARIRELFAAFRVADLAAITGTIAEDAVWHFPGRDGQLAGDHAGCEAIVAFLLNVQRLTNHTFGLELIDVIANDGHAVALFRGHASRNGRTLDNPTCLRMRIQDGRVMEVWEFVWNLYDVDAFWS
jgi:uncharacterized protein